MLCFPLAIYVSVFRARPCRSPFIQSFLLCERFPSHCNFMFSLISPSFFVLLFRVQFAGKYWIWVHSQRQWAKLPSCIPHLTQASGVLGYMRCRNSGVKYIPQGTYIKKDWLDHQKSWIVYMFFCQLLFTCSFVNSSQMGQCFKVTPWNEGSPSSPIHINRPLLQPHRPNRKWKKKWWRSSSDRDF